MTLSRREFLALTAGLCCVSGHGSEAATPFPPSGGFGIAGTVLTGESPPLPNHVVLVDDGTIEAILPVSDITNLPILAPRGCTIMPGVINAHCHRIYPATERRHRWLEHGVTAIGDVGAPLSALSKLTDSPAGATATAAFSGPMLTPPSGYPLPVHNPQYAFVVTSPGAGRDAVRQLADLGATLVKISFEPGPLCTNWPTLTPGTAHAICDQARKQGMVVRCHVEDLSGLEPALNAGVHVVDHVPHRWTVRKTMRPVLHTVNGRLEPVPHYRAQLERMVRDRVILVPTLDVLSRSPWNGPELFEPVNAFAAMGGRIGLGNDYPYRRTDAGMPMQELALLARAGLAPDAVITAATATAGAACNFPDRGRLAPGAKADILIVTGDPLTDIGTLAHPLHIMKEGIFIS